MSITGVDSIIAGSIKYPFYKVSATSKAAAAWQSLWTTGSNAGVAPAGYTTGTGYTPTNSTSGAFPFTNPTSGETRLSQISCAGSTVGTLIIYDRLWACSGMSGTVATAQAVTTPGSLTRYTSNYTGVEAWLEVYSATGSTAVTATLTYVNQAGTAGKTGTAAVVATTVAGQMIPFTLAAGDTGVQQVTSVTLSATTGTTGSFGVTLLKRLAEIPITVANVGSVLDFGGTGLPVIQNNACLAFAVQCSTTSTGSIMGSISIAQG